MSKLTDLMDAVRANSDYLQADGTMGLTCEPKTDNQFLFSATYYEMVRRLGGEDPAFAEFELFVNAQQNPGRPGLYTPPPSWDVPVISHDENVGLCVADPVLASDIAHYGIWHGWVFNNLDFAWTKANLVLIAGQWQARFGWTVPFMRIAGGLPSGTILTWLFNNLTFALELYIATRSEPGETSGRCMLYLISRTVLTKGSLPMKLAMSWFLADCEKTYGDLNGLYKIYFGPVHPMALAAVGMPFDYRKGNGS